MGTQINTTEKKKQKQKKLLIFVSLFGLIQNNLNGSNTGGSFTVDDSNSFFSPYKILPIAQDNKYLVIFFFLFYHGIVELWNSGDSNEYSQHTIFL